jgi:hypothetical protein
MDATGIKGFNEVMQNLNAKIAEIKKGSMKGLIEAAAFIREDMDKTPPLIPLDTGNLRATWGTRPIDDLELEMGFSANYAFYVHEMMEPGKAGWRYGPGPGKKRWYEPRPGAGPKFFEAAMKRNTDKILEIIRKNAEIK